MGTVLAEKLAEAGVVDPQQVNKVIEKKAKQEQEERAVQEATRIKTWTLLITRPAEGVVGVYVPNFPRRLPRRIAARMVEAVLAATGCEKLVWIPRLPKSFEILNVEINMD